MKIFKLFLSFLISVILVCSAMVLQISISLKHDMFNDNFYLDKINASKISDKLEKSIYSKFYDYASKNKLPTSATTDIISPLWIDQQFTNVTKGLISYISGETNILPVVDSKTPTDNFNLNLPKKLAEKNQPVDNVINASKLEFLKSFRDIPLTESWNQINGAKLKDTLNYYKKYVRILNFVPYVSALILFVCILLLLFTNSRLISRKLWTGYALIIGGLLPSVAGFVIANSSISTNFLNNHIVIAASSVFPPKATISLLTDIANSFLMGLTKYGAVFVFLGIAIILVISFFDGTKAEVFWYKHKPLK